MSFCIAGPFGDRREILVGLGRWRFSAWRVVTVYPVRLRWRSRLWTSWDTFVDVKNHRVRRSVGTKARAVRGAPSASIGGRLRASSRRLALASCGWLGVLHFPGDRAGDPHAEDLDTERWLPRKVWGTKIFGATRWPTTSRQDP